MKINLIDKDFESFLEGNGLTVSDMPEGLAELLRAFYAAGAYNVIFRLSTARLGTMSRTLKNWRENAAEYLDTKPQR